MGASLPFCLIKANLPPEWGFLSVTVTNGPPGPLKQHPTYRTCHRRAGDLAPQVTHRWLDVASSWCCAKVVQGCCRQVLCGCRLDPRQFTSSLRKKSSAKGQGLRAQKFPVSCCTIPAGGFLLKKRQPRYCSMIFVQLSANKGGTCVSAISPKQPVA